MPKQMNSDSGDLTPHYNRACNRDYNSACKYSKYLEWGGCILGLVVATLLALNNSLSGYGFIAFAIANGFWIAFALVIGSRALLIMQLGFVLSSALGIYRWFFWRGA